MKFDVWFCGFCLISALCYSENVLAKSEEASCDNDEKGIVYCVDGDNRPFTGKIKNDKNGQYTSIENYKNGYRDGLSTFFDKDGKIKERVYYKQGVKNGMDKLYYPNRGIKVSVNYKNGLLHGQSDIYDEDGKLSGRVSYKNGFLEKGFCQNEQGKKEEFSAEYLANYQENNLEMCGAK